MKMKERGPEKGGDHSLVHLLAVPPVQTTGNGEYDQRSCQKRPKLWVDSADGVAFCILHSAFCIPWLRVASTRTSAFCIQPSAFAFSRDFQGVEDLTNWQAWSLTA
jgi:hypothetical protein